MAPRQTPLEKNGAYPSLEHVIKAEDNYHFVPNDESSEGGALVPQDATVADCDDWLDRIQYTRKRRASLVSWPSTTVEAARDSSDEDFDTAPLPARGSYRAPGPPPDADDASFAQTPALSSPRAFSESTGPLEHPSPAARGSTWSILADSSGEDVEPDPASDDAQHPVAKRSKTKVVFSGSRARRRQGKKGPPRPSAKAHSKKGASRPFKCRYILQSGEYCQGACGKLYDLARHMVTVHGRNELNLVVAGQLVHHPDGSPFAEGEKPAYLLGALWPRVKWSYLHKIGLATYDFNPLHWLVYITKLYPCWQLGCPSDPFPRSDSLWKHLREQHKNRTREENDAMQPPGYDPTHVNKERVQALFGTPVVPTAASSAEDTDAMDVAPTRRLSIQSGSRIKQEGPSPRIPLLPLGFVPELPRSTRSSRKHEASSLPKHVTFNVPALDAGLRSPSASPLVHTPAPLPIALPSPAQMPRILATPEKFTAHLPRSPLRFSTLPLVDETAALQSQLLDTGSWHPASDSRKHLRGSFTEIRSPQTVYSPALSTPGGLPHPTLLDSSNLSPAAAPMPVLPSPHMPEPAFYYGDSDELVNRTGSLGLALGGGLPLTVSPAQLGSAEPAGMAYAEQPVYDAGPSWEVMPMQQDGGFDVGYAQQFSFESQAQHPFRAGASGAIWLSPPTPMQLPLDPASGDPSPRSPLAHIPDGVVPHYAVDGLHSDAGCTSGPSADHVHRLGHALAHGPAGVLYGADAEMYDGQSASVAGLDDFDLEKYVNFDG